MKEHWWTWKWDTATASNVEMQFKSFTRWRRGWLTLYKFIGYHSIEWRLYLPFNLCVGISFNGK